MSRTMMWIKTTIVEPFPVFFAHVAYPDEGWRATAKGPFAAAGSSDYTAFSAKHMAHALFRAGFLRERGWTVILELEERTARGAPADPAILSAAAINMELNRLDNQRDDNTLAFIAAGRGHERPSEYLEKEDALSLEARRIWARQSALRAEIARRCGPDAPSRLPRGFGPLTVV